MKEEKLLPELRFPEFEKSWKKLKLGDIADVIDPHPSHRAPNPVQINGIPFIGIGDISEEGVVCFENVRMVSKEIYKEHNVRYKLEIGDFAFGRVASIGKVVDLSSNISKKYTYSPTLAIIKPLRINSAFLRTYVKTDYFTDKVNSKSTGSTRRSLGMQNLRILDILHPSSEEQQKIATFLTSVDKRIQLLTQKKEKLEEYKKGVMQGLFAGHGQQQHVLAHGSTHAETHGRASIQGNNDCVPLRFTDENGNNYPDWEEKKLGEVANRIGDGLHGTPIYVNDSEIYFINGNNLINGKIEINESTKRVDIETFTKNDKKLTKGSILISINGTIGSIARYGNEKVMLGKSVGYFNFNDNSEFFFHLLQTNSIQNFFISELTGSTIKNLSLKTLRETKTNLPCKEEQQKIASFLSALDKQIEQVARQVEKMKEWKKGLLQGMFV